MLLGIDELSITHPLQAKFRIHFLMYCIIILNLYLFHYFINVTLQNRIGTFVCHTVSFCFPGYFNGLKKAIDINDDSCQNGELCSEKH